MRTVRDILADLKIESVKLLTNNPRKIKMLQGHGIFIVERLPVLASSSAHSANPSECVYIPVNVSRVQTNK